MAVGVQELRMVYESDTWFLLGETPNGVRHRVEGIDESGIFDGIDVLGVLFTELVES